MNKIKISSYFPHSPSFLKVKYTLSLISLLGILGTCTFVSEVAMGEVNSPKIKQSTSENIHTINGKLDRNSKKFSKSKTYYNIHKFEGKAGEKIVLDLISKDFDAYLILRDPKNKKIARNNNSGDENNARIVVTLPSTGTYTIIAKTHKGGESGNYQLNRRAASPRDLELADIQKLIPGDGL